MNWIDRRRQTVRRRRLKLAATGLAALVAVLFVAGLALPAEHVSTSRMLVDRPPEAVWRVLTDLDGMPLWRSDLAAIERLPDFRGKPAWREIGRGGGSVVEVYLGESPRRLVMQAADEGEPGLPIRVFDLISVRAGTEVTLTERAASSNPFRRVLVRLGGQRPAIDRFLRDLAGRLGTNRRTIAAE
jgi:uncharacterized protein YndB with AHSA1/START domain